jgi:hypothetical protein
MRNRHLPRLCRSCGGPMARQEDTCWRCGARCADELQPAAQPRVVLPMALTSPDLGTAAAVGAANGDADRGAHEGGAVDVPDGAAAVAGSGGRR